MSSKNLYVEQADVPHAASRRASTTWSDGSPLRDERYVKKLSNLLCLTRCGFYDHLEEDRSIYINMGMQCRPHRTLQLSFSNYPSFKTKSEQIENVVLSCCHVVPRNDAFVKLYGRSHPAPTLYEGDLLSGSWALWVSRVEGVQGFCEVHGFKDLISRRS